MEIEKTEDFVIYYASQTGTAEGFAEVLKSQAKKKIGLRAKVINLADLTMEAFLSNTKAVFLMATHYEGDPPDNAEAFWKWFSDESKWGSDNLETHKFTCFALGDTSYEDSFAHIGQETNRLMLKYGAKSIYKLGIGDDVDDDIESYFKKWKKKIWPSLKEHFGAAEAAQEPAPETNPFKKKANAESEQLDISKLSSEPRKLPFEGIISSFHKEQSFKSQAKQSSKYQFNVKNFLSFDTMRIVNIAELRDEASPNNFTKIIDIFGENLKYKTAGNIQIYPNNSKDSIARMKKVMRAAFDFIFTTTSKGDDKLPIPSPLSLGNYLKHFIDLSADITTADLVKMEDLLSELEYYKVKRFVEGKKANHEVINLLDILENVELDKTPHLSFLISLNKRIDARPYTICSSAKVSPNLVQIAISSHEIKKSGRLGLFTNFIKDCEARLKGDRKDPVYVQARIVDSTFSLPAKPNTPILMFANGAGIAPMRGIIQEKVRSSVEGEECGIGLMGLFFGTRTDKDLLFKGEYEVAVKTGCLKDFKVAYSRMKNEKKTYIQELIYPNKNVIIDYIIKGKGVIYLCGSAGLKDGVYTKLKKIFDERNMENYLEKLLEEKRLMVECWG